MADVKWIKLSIDMFNNRKIKYLRSLPEGNNIILIWVMLLSIAGRCNASGMIFLTENVPYTTKILAKELEFEENTIVLAINALVQLEMIEYYNEKLIITGWEEHQNIDGLEKIREQARLRQAKLRNKQKLLLEDNVTSNVTVTQCNDIEKETEEDKEIDNSKDIAHSKESTEKVSKKDVNNFFEDMWRLYPNKKGKAQIKDTKKKELYTLGIETISKCIDRYKNELDKDSSWRKPQNGSTFFNSGYVDYLDENYAPRNIKEEIHKSNNKFNNFSQREYSQNDYSSIEQMLLNNK